MMMRGHLLRGRGESKTQRHTHQPGECSWKFSDSLVHLLLRFKTGLAPKPMLRFSDYTKYHSSSRDAKRRGNFCEIYSSEKKAAPPTEADDTAYLSIFPPPF